jgi:hypothetical protein
MAVARPGGGAGAPREGHGAGPGRREREHVAQLPAAAEWRARGLAHTCAHVASRVSVQQRSGLRIPRSAHANTSVAAATLTARRSLKRCMMAALARRAISAKACGHSRVSSRMASAHSRVQDLNTHTCARPPTHLAGLAVADGGVVLELCHAVQQRPQRLSHCQPANAQPRQAVRLRRLADARSGGACRRGTTGRQRQAGLQRLPLSATPPCPGAACTAPC